jgi:hypothetical protein
LTFFICYCRYAFSRSSSLAPRFARYSTSSCLPPTPSVSRLLMIITRRYAPRPKPTKGLTSVDCRTASHPKEREIVKKGWGTWTNFMQSYGLKAYDLDDIDEAKAILSAMAANED